MVILSSLQTWTSTAFSLMLHMVCSVVWVWLGIAWVKNRDARIFEITQRLYRRKNEFKLESEKILESGESLLTNVARQSSALQETSAALEELASAVHQSAANATKSHDLANTSVAAANQGKQAVHETIRAVEAIFLSNETITREIETSNQAIQSIVKVVMDIRDKTNIINDIVFQTKLLSFNASVEAARAGEKGKGFAVVAEEVGNLARRSGIAAKQISDLLAESTQLAKSLVEESNQRVQHLVRAGAETVQNGVVSAANCGTVLERVTESIGEVNQMIGEIAVATKEQATGVSEISKAMNELEQTNHTNAAAAQQITAISTRLSSLAEIQDDILKGNGDKHTAK